MPMSILDKVSFSYHASRGQLDVYEAATNAFYLQVRRWISGSGHPTSCDELLANLPPPSDEERVLRPAEIRPYFLLKALTDNRYLPTYSDFIVKVCDVTVSVGVTLMSLMIIADCPQGVAP